VSSLWPPIPAHCSTSSSPAADNRSKQLAEHVRRGHSASNSQRNSVHNPSHTHQREHRCDYDPAQRSLNRCPCLVRVRRRAATTSTKYSLRIDNPRARSRSLSLVVGRQKYGDEVRRPMLCHAGDVHTTYTDPLPTRFTSLLLPLRSLCIYSLLPTNYERAVPPSRMFWLCISLVDGLPGYRLGT